MDVVNNTKNYIFIHKILIKFTYKNKIIVYIKGFIMYSFRPMQAPSSNGSAELTIIFLFVLFLLLVSSAATGIYFYTREETNCNKI